MWTAIKEKDGGRRQHCNGRAQSEDDLVCERREKRRERGAEEARVKRREDTIERPLLVSSNQRNPLIFNIPSRTPQAVIRMSLASHVE